MTGIFLGPLSSASPDGPGPFFSFLFVLAGGYGLTRAWFGARNEGSRPVRKSDLIGITVICVLFVAIGLGGVLSSYGVHLRREAFVWLGWVLGPALPWLLVAVGGYVLFGTWWNYGKIRRVREVSVLLPIGITVVCLIVIAVGIHGIFSHR